MKSNYSYACFNVFLVGHLAFRNLWKYYKHNAFSFFKICKMTTRSKIDKCVLREPQSSFLFLLIIVGSKNWPKWFILLGTKRKNNGNVDSSPGPCWCNIFKFGTQLLKKKENQEIGSYFLTNKYLFSIFFDLWMKNNFWQFLTILFFLKKTHVGHFEINCFTGHRTPFESRK